MCMCTSKITGNIVFKDILSASVYMCIFVHTVRQYILVSALTWHIYINVAYNCSVSTSH